MIYYNVFTDGSYLDGDGHAHGGIVFVNNDTHEPASMLHVQTTVPDFVNMWNIGGELLAMWAALFSITSAVIDANENKGIESYEALLTYDYEGLGRWLHGEWKIKKPVVRWCINSIKQRLAMCPNLKLKTQWVRGHRGIRFNELADGVSSYLSGNWPHGTILCDMDETLKEIYKI